MKSVISIIIPVYNVEKYLLECIESILSQTYRYLEIILVDDGSTDRSGRICDEYAEKDSRIKVIHQKNGGAANAKNAGLMAATGKYLAFVDSDDYLEKDAYSYMLSELESCNADIIQCSFRNVYVDHQENMVVLKEQSVFETQDYLKRYTIDWTCGLLWDKLYKRELFDNVFFEEGHKIDDEFFTYQGVMNARKIVHCPEIVYNYRKRKSSVMISERSAEKIVADKVEYLEKRREKVVERFPQLGQAFNYHFLSMMVILSKDKNVTEDTMIHIKNAILNYEKNRAFCKMEWSLRWQILCLKYLSVKFLMNKRKYNVSEENSFQYFE